LDGEANLVWRTAVELAESRGIRPKARIMIRKRIPVGMGLGGGSSDAAAALIGLNKLWNLCLDPEELAQIAAGLGSDVPFFLQGGTALAEGRGEEISPLPSLPRLGVLLICPGETLPNKTATLFSLMTAGHYSDGGITRQMVATLMSGQFVVDMVHNVFEEVAFNVFPGLSPIYRRLEGLTASPLRLSGAGPALFCLPDSQEEFSRVSEALPPHQGRAYLVQTITPAEAGMAASGADYSGARIPGASNKNPSKSSTGSPN
jgi:4-diphosphocytidyl-2-C-methyl-D-erythritol kinase